MTGNLIVEERDFPLNGATNGTVELELASGGLRLAGGADGFADAVFRYSHPGLRPDIEFGVDGIEAELEVALPQLADLANSKVEWDLRLNSKVDLELAVEAGSAVLDLDLSAISPTGLEARIASGDLLARFGGDYPALDEIVVEVQSGNCDLDLAGRFELLERVEVAQTSGNVRLALTGAYPALDRVTVDSTSGIVDLDLRGKWPAGDIGVRVQGASGQVTVRLPDDVGVSLGARTQAGMISASGLSERDGRLVNAAFGSSETIIWLNVRLASGMINVV